MTIAEYNKVNNICLVILTAIALTAALIYTKPVMVPFVLALFIYTASAPFVSLLERRLRVHHFIAVGLAFILIFLIFSLCIFLAGVSLNVFFEGATFYKNQFLTLLDSVAESLRKFGIELEPSMIKKELTVGPTFSVAKQVTSSVISFISTSTLIGVFLIFLFVSGSKNTGLDPFIEEIQHKISKYVVVKLLSSLITGFLVAVILKIFNVELALMFAIVTILFNFIPSIGSIIATALPIPILFLQFGVQPQVFIILFLLAAIQFIIGNIIEPKIMGENMDLHPVTVLAFLIFWGLVWGVPGMFLAVPITAILKIILSRIPTTKVVAEILAGRIPRMS